MPALSSGAPLTPTGRLAPSPTGLLHLGHARTFLLAWWRARSLGGRILLRMEDLDGARSRADLAEQAARDLEWLGVDWDGPIHIQSAGVERMMSAVHELLREGRAYACSCTRGEIRSAASAPQQGSDEPRYPGTCRGLYRSLADAEESTGRAPAVRLEVPAGAVRFYDAVYGEQSFDVARDVGDFVIARRDGAPAYQLAAVIDDAASGVTEVVRGSDLLASTARQRVLQAVLGLIPPSYVHVPLVLDEDGRRLAKRARDLGIGELRARGADPRKIVSWAARSAGLDVGARSTAREALGSFDLSRLSTAPVRLSLAVLAELEAP